MGEEEQQEAEHKMWGAQEDRWGNVMTSIRRKIDGQKAPDVIEYPNDPFVSFNTV